MKNLLIYTGPQKKFSSEDETLVKIQIDNSLELGWKRDDLLLVTDFPFQHNGISSTIIPDKIYYDFDINANKIPVIVYLIKNGLIKDDKLYWCHDLDAFENNEISESELELSGYDLGLTHYTYKPEWQCGSLFFKTRAFDIFELIHTETLRKPHASRNNEKTLTKLIKDDRISNIRYKRLNPTYNFMKKYIETIYKISDKPLKIIHFRPSNALDIFMYGKNSLKMPLINERLIEIFKTHGVK